MLANRLPTLWSYLTLKISSISLFLGQIYIFAFALDTRHTFLNFLIDYPLYNTLRFFLLKTDTLIPFCSSSFTSGSSRINSCHSAMIDDMFASYVCYNFFHKSLWSVIGDSLSVLCNYLHDSLVTAYDVLLRK